MNSPLQTISNICVVLAAIIYLVPLQQLVWDFAHKRNDSVGGLIAGLIILVPLWLLLLVGLLSVTATGGFDWLWFNRGALYLFVIAATLGMAVASFLFMGMTPRTPFFQGVVICAPVYLLPALSMVLVVLSLNPRLAPGIPPQVFRLPWITGAALSLMAGLGFAGYQLVRSGGNRLAGVSHRLHESGPSAAEQLAKIAALDSQHDFADLLGLASQYYSRDTREAATARLRTNPAFLETLIAEVKTSEPSKALEFISSATFSAEELTALAAPTRQAIERFIAGIPAPNYLPSDRRKQLQRWGRATFRELAKKFAPTGVDFSPTLAAFEQALEPANR